MSQKTPRGSAPTARQPAVKKAAAAGKPPAAPVKSPVKKQAALPKTVGGAKRSGAAKQPRFYQRFHWSQRVTHALLLTSFTLLAFTGLPQKFPLTSWGRTLIGLFGGIELTRQIHHVSAVVLLLLGIYHTLDAIYKIFVRRVRLLMLPGLKDARDAWQAFLYNLGFARKRPQMGRYTFEEKMEYWALLWGTVIMAITGFMMWNPIATARFLPGEIIPAAKAAHGGEALLAVAAIIIWHMYSVHVKRFNKSMFTGKLSEEEMLHEHPLELADIKAGIAERPVEPSALRRRQAIYFPIAIVLSAVMLLGVYGFIAGEKTAIETVPPIRDEVPIFVPYTPTPNPTSPVIDGPLTWDGMIGSLLLQRCGACHTTGSTSGLVLTSFTEAMRGGNDGAVILPGDSAGSPLVLLQASGTHFATLGADELIKVQQWIDAGAPEK
jgi:cytochrome b subunit of formate dehydrogenase